LLNLIHLSHRPVLTHASIPTTNHTEERTRCRLHCRRGQVGLAFFFFNVNDDHTGQ
jgi:hypothetical protein